MKREIARKVFHLLTLVYLWAYWTLGTTKTLWLLGGWIALEALVEFVRLRNSAINEQLITLFGAINRESERTKMSGIVWTSLGCWWTIFLFGARSEVVAGAILYLALGDAAAALVGKAFGRHRLPFGDGAKTWEGTLGCFAVCAAIGFFLQLDAARLIAGAIAATALESMVLPLNDNLWLPIGSGFVLYLFV